MLAGAWPLSARSGNATTLTSSRFPGESDAACAGNAPSVNAVTAAANGRIGDNTEMNTITTTGLMPLSATGAARSNSWIRHHREYVSGPGADRITRASSTVRSAKRISTFADWQPFEDWNTAGVATSAECPGGHRQASRVIIGQAPIADQPTITETIAYARMSGISRAQRCVRLDSRSARPGHR